MYELIHCPACDKECSSQATSCPHCGQPLTPKMPSPAPQDAPIQTDPPPKTWLVESILATVLCCNLLGIVGIIYAAKVESLWSQGRRAEALDASRSAKIWTLVAVIIAVIFWVIYGSLIALGIVAGINGW